MSVTSRTATSERTRSAAAERPEDLPAHKCGHYGHLSKRTRKPCGQNVDRGTTHCRSHAGVSREKHKAEGLLRLEVSKWTLDGHDGADLDPRIEILRLIAFWKWRVNLYGSLLEKAYAAADALKAAHRGEGIVTISLDDPEWDVDEKGDVMLEHPELQTARRNLSDAFRQGGVTALIGHQFDVDRNGRVFAVTEGIRALVTLEERAHTMLAKMCDLAVKAKIAEARIQLAEQVGVMIQAIILGVLRDVGVVADSRVQAIIAANIDTVVANNNPAIAA